MSVNGRLLEPRLVMMLVGTCNWHELALRRHGMTSEGLMRFAEKAAVMGLRRRGAVLGDRFDDLVSKLILAGLGEVLTYDPQKAGLRYGTGGGDPFQSRLADVMDHRIDDFYRSRSEGFSDRRYKNYGEVTPTEQVDPDADQQHAVEEAIERLDSAANLEWYIAGAEAEGLALHDWVIRALNERASRTTTRPTVQRSPAEPAEPGPDHWPGQHAAVEVA